MWILVFGMPTARHIQFEQWNIRAREDERSNMSSLPTVSRGLKIIFESIKLFNILIFSSEGIGSISERLYSVIVYELPFNKVLFIISAFFIYLFCPFASLTNTPPFREYSNKLRDRWNVFFYRLEQVWCYISVTIELHNIGLSLVAWRKLANTSDLINEIICPQLSQIFYQD